MTVFNREWHLKHPFPHGKEEAQKDKWRSNHAKNCTCGVRKKAKK